MLEILNLESGGPGAGESAVSDNDKEYQPVNCFDCRSFFITHEPARPYGCRAMGFKSRELPSAAVLRSSGEPCLCHESKGRG
jgi:hypothetical protein